MVKFEESEFELEKRGNLWPFTFHSRPLLLFLFFVFFFIKCFSTTKKKHVIRNVLFDAGQWIFGCKSNDTI